VTDPTLPITNVDVDVARLRRADILGLIYEYRLVA
jgi:hypothetical protein